LEVQPDDARDARKPCLYGAKLGMYCSGEPCLPLLLVLLL
jgi:hypothetical protein